MLRLAPWFVAFFVTLVFAGCSFESDLVSAVECTAGETRNDGAQCRDGFWVGGSDLDASNGDAEIDMTNGGDAEVEMGCTAETDPEFCARLGKNCGVVEDVDNCGANRQASCGTCTAPDTCQGDNTCTCVPESEAEFCQRLSKDCGMVTAPDNCGAEKTYDCGSCMGNEECGEQQANVCGCPCNIDGTCYPEGAVNPGDACEICDTSESTTAWTLDVGRSCNDGDLCTENDVCGGNGSCTGAPLDCSAEDGECRVGMCDDSSGTCFGMAESGTPCGGDGLSCTEDVCAVGVCEHNLTGGCIIDNTCYAANAPNPTNGCEACLPGTSTSDWSANDSGSCDDGLSCTTDTCSAGACTSSLSAGSCLIGGSCFSSGTDNPSDACLTCNASADSTGWTLKASCCRIGGTTYASGQSNPGEACEVCDSGANQNDWSIDNDCCLISATYYTSGTPNPANDCEECDSAASSTDWSNVATTESCCAGEGGTWRCTGSGQCQKQTGGMDLLVCAP